MGDEQFLQCEHYSSKGFSIQFKDRCGFEIGSKAASVQNHFLVRKSMVSNNIQNQYRFMESFKSSIGPALGPESVWIQNQFQDMV